MHTLTRADATQRALHEYRRGRLGRKELVKTMGALPEVMDGHCQGVGVCVGGGGEAVDVYTLTRAITTTIIN